MLSILVGDLSKCDVVNSQIITFEKAFLKKDSGDHRYGKGERENGVMGWEWCVCDAREKCVLSCLCLSGGTLHFVNRIFLVVTTLSLCQWKHILACAPQLDANEDIREWRSEWIW